MSEEGELRRLSVENVTPEQYVHERAERIRMLREAQKEIADENDQARKKLTLPPIDHKHTNCSNLPKISPVDLLYYGNKSRIRELYDNIPKPGGVLPKLHLPSWEEFSLDQKLPQINLGPDFQFTRAKLNESLKYDEAGHGVMWTSADPYNAYNYVPTPEYNALHDPATRKYFSKPHIKKLLVKQGLITPEEEVICSLSDMNRYRAYVKHYHDNFIASELNNEIAKLKSENHLNKELRQYMALGQNEHRGKLDAIKQRQREMDEERVRRLREKIERDDEKERRLREQIRSYRDQLREESRKTWQDKRNEIILKQNSKGDSKFKLLELLKKQEKAEYAAYLIRMKKEAERETRMNQFMMRRIAFEREEKKRSEEIARTIKAMKECKKKEYEERINRARRIFPTLGEKKRLKEEHLQYLMRKYFNLWVRIVRKSRVKRHDEKHMSSWDVTATQEKTVKHLRELTGHEKLDAFIFSLIKLKKGQEPGGGDAHKNPHGDVLIEPI